MEGKEMNEKVTDDSAQIEQKEQDEQEEPKKKLFFANKKFWIGFLCAIAPFAVPVLLGFMLRNEAGYTVSVLMALAIIPYAVFGLVLWAAFRGKNKRLALGLMLGCITPFLIFFVMTGGCGLAGSLNLEGISLF